MLRNGKANGNTFLLTAYDLWTVQHKEITTSVCGLTLGCVPDSLCHGWWLHWGTPPSRIDSFSLGWPLSALTPSDRKRGPVVRGPMKAPLVENDGCLCSSWALFALDLVSIKKMITWNKGGNKRRLVKFSVMELLGSAFCIQLNVISHSTGSR